MKNVLVCYRGYNYASRCVISGVQKFVSEKGDWLVRLVSFPETLTADMVRNAPAEGVNGILFPNFSEPGVDDAIVRTPLPVVVGNTAYNRIKRRKKNIAIIDICDRDVGAMGARHLLGLGKFNSYAFAPHTDAPNWSEERRKGFIAELRRHGVKATVLAGGGTLQEIADLPKPAAVMAAWDFNAITIMAHAQKAGLAIPGDIAVVGVDADPIVCGFSNPSLTSVEPGFERMGYAGAAAMDAMMSGRKLDAAKKIRCLPRGVLEHASTYFLSTGRILVDRAKTIIAQQAANGLKSKELSAQLKVSPQLLALRFRQYEKTTPLDMIIKTRLEAAKRLMKNPGIKLDSIASQCGFSSKNRLFHVFKQRFAMTIGEYRDTL